MHSVEQHLLPLAQWIKRRKPDKPLVVGMNGAQGSGKSTTTAALAIMLKHSGLSVATLSIDDLYLTRLQRKVLSEDIHPLLATRGVPGTHDVEMGIELIQKLITASGEVPLPRFDKSIDDRLPEKDWPRYLTPVDIVLFEGWCIATPPQSQNELLSPMNGLEVQADPNGEWRGFVNSMLAGRYHSLFTLIDVVVYLKIPAFDSILKWRGRQERQTFNQSCKPEEGMNAEQLTRFIQHFERLTRHSMEKLPELADVMLELDGQQKIIQSHYR